ncbi:MAG: hypothetical protein RM022_012145 [Nostoc sp. EfeVER01]|nr:MULTISPECIES: hypothetical protein [unclassified Nostoc]MDZ7945614.1 hypothetical protein [Nostoc sp. EfeVER01]MDZ7993100.1 hypothetical protein [Nostoc sp. EspVER01]
MGRGAEGQRGKNLVFELSPAPLLKRRLNRDVVRNPGSVFWVRSLQKGGLVGRLDSI